MVRNEQKLVLSQDLKDLFFVFSVVRLCLSHCQKEKKNGKGEKKKKNKQVWVNLHLRKMSLLSRDGTPAQAGLD